jgi:hypothetical protein
MEEVSQNYHTADNIQVAIMSGRIQAQANSGIQVYMAVSCGRLESMLEGQKNSG